MRQNVLWLMVALFVFFFSSCNKDGGDSGGVTPPVVIDPPAERDTVVRSRGEAPDVLKVNDFSFRFLQAMSEEEEGRNLLLSPLSAGIPLAMLANGAAGETRDALLGLLGYGEAGLEKMNEHFGGVKNLGSSSEDVIVEQATVVWTDLPYPALPSYAETMQAAYGAEVKENDFSDPATLGLINAWSAEKTHDRIPELLEELNGTTYLIHALYFKGLWESPFSPKNTKEETFTNADGSASAVPVMAQENTAFAYRGESFDALEMDYRGGEYSMVILLPKEGASLASVEKQLGQDFLGNLLSEMYLCEASIKLPRFRIEYGQILNGLLKRMAGSALFSEGDYSLLSPVYKGASITVVQKTFAEINEEGTEAAAVTYVKVWGSSEPQLYPRIDFHVNRPFLFLIQEKKSGAILFGGRILSL